MDYDALAKQFGAVEAAQQPQANMPDWMSRLSPKDQVELQMKQHEEGRKRIASLDESISSEGKTVEWLKRFGALNQNSRTGGLHEQIFSGTGLGRGDDEKEMIAIQSYLAPKMRETGSGATSDRDVSMFLSALPGIDKPGNVNRDIRENFMTQYNKAVEKRTAMESYLNNNGTLVGFDDQWSKRGKPAAAPVQPAQPQKPKPGSVVDGYQFLGGDPGNPKMWAKVKR
jgi:hypothetical protein